MAGVACASLSDCPGCGSLCYGPSILPCSHLVCRKCLRQLLAEGIGNGAVCPTCCKPANPDGIPASVFTQQFGTDPVVEELVKERMVQESSMKCCVHWETSAAHFCTDCAEPYCNSCSEAHRNMGLTKSHDQIDIPLQTSTERKSETSTTTSSSKKVLGSDGISERDEENEKNVLRDLLQKELMLFRATENQVVASISETEDSISQLHAVKAKLQDKREILNVYVTHLANPETMTTKKPGAIMSRLKRVREDCCPVSATRSEAVETVTSTTTLESEATEKRDDKPEVAEHRLAQWWRLFENSLPNAARRYVPSRLFLPVGLVSICLVLVMALMLAPPKRTSPDPTQPHPSWIDPFQLPVPFQFNPGMNKPKELDSCTPYPTSKIKSLVATRDNRLVMADAGIKGVIVKSPQQTESILLNTVPLGLAHLRNGLIAVTSQTEKRIILLNIDAGIRIDHEIQTARHYYGVAPNNDDDTMIVSCKKDKDDPASVDVIAVSDGVVKKAVVERSLLEFMDNPCYLTIVNGDLLVSDCQGSTMYQVEIQTGLLRTMHGVPRPQAGHVLRQVTSDRAGNLYVASRTQKCVTVKIHDSPWKCLDLDHYFEYPEALAVTNAGQLVVSWQKEYYDSSLVMEYDLGLLTDVSDGDSVTNQ